MSDDGYKLAKDFEHLLIAEADALVRQMLKKRADYGSANLLLDGEFGIMVRVSDKVSRIRSLLKSGKDPNFESIEDTWSDIATYAILALALRHVGPEQFASLPINALAAGIVQDGASAVARAVAESMSGIAQELSRKAPLDTGELR